VRRCNPYPRVVGSRYRSRAHTATVLAAHPKISRIIKLLARTAGNGSLMRTAPVALAYLDDEASLVEAARAVSELTHYDPEAGDASVLWCCAIRHAILTGALDARIGLQYIGADRREKWAARLDTAKNSRPSDFKINGWVVEALPAAWSAITTTPVPQGNRLRVFSASTISALPLTPRCEAAGIPTPLRPSRVD
jgi:ADP-ribosyl-[dinitrogen reductase] hydrolase